MSVPTSGSFADIVVPADANALSDFENKAVLIKDDYNGIPNYTGGNAANTLRVTVYYIVVDL